MKKIITVVLSFALGVSFCATCYAELFYVDRFEKTGNLLGGRTNVYEQAPSRATAATTDRERYGSSGKSLVMRYDKKSTGGPYDSGGWCGYYTILKTGPKYLDAMNFTNVTFWVKGEKGGENFKVGLADRHWEQVGDSLKSDDITAYLSPNNQITTEWQKATIPLDVFFLDMKEVASLAICFEGDCFPEGDGRGMIYIDDIAFE